MLLDIFNLLLPFWIAITYVFSLFSLVKICTCRRFLLPLCLININVKTQAQLVEIYQSSKSNISEHLKNIFDDKELDKEVVVRKFRTTTQHGAIEGKTQTHEVLHYNLDVIIAVNDNAKVYQQIIQ